MQFNFWRHNYIGLKIDLMLYHHRKFSIRKTEAGHLDVTKFAPDSLARLICRGYVMMWGTS